MHVGVSKNETTLLTSFITICSQKASIAANHAIILNSLTLYIYVLQL